MSYAAGNDTPDANQVGLTFWAPFTDSGSGVLNTTLSRGTGSITVTRATQAACRLSSGLWKLDVASGTPRSHYLSDLTYGGGLIEQLATQLVVAGSVRDMTNAAWVKTTMTTAQTSTGIDGAANSCTRLTATAGNATALQTLVAAASSRTYSCFIKRVTGTGNIEITQDGASWTNIAGQINSSGFTLVQLNASILNASFGIRIVTNGDAIDVDCNQFEAGSFATTPIPAAGTRNGDVWTYPISGNIDQTVGSAFCRFVVAQQNPAIGQPLIANQLGAGNAQLYVASGSSTQLSCFDGTSIVLSAAVSDFRNTVTRGASTWGGSSRAIYVNGGSKNTGAFDGDYNGTAIHIGCSASAAQLNGCIRDIRIWQRVLSDSQIASIK